MEVRSQKSEIRNVPAIILAGGLGTRLRGVINDLPKTMAPVNGKPFLHYVFKYLVRQKISAVVLSIGYKRESIQEYFGNKYLGISIQYAIEEEPLGTGGGIKKAFELIHDYAFVLNGDTFFDIDLSEMKKFGFETSADISLALKPMKNFDRYGTVKLKEERIINFEEKKLVAEGLINGGIYLFRKKIFTKIATDQKFSFEKDILEKYVAEIKINGKIFNNYFIDIGVPEDYSRVQQDFKKMFS